MLTIIIYFLVLQLASAQKFVGDSCTLPDKTKGTCKIIHECRLAKEELRNNERPITCGFDKKTIIVCCPASISVAKCNEFSGEIKKIKTPFIIGGRNAVLEEYPHMTALGYGEEKDLRWFCGGSLISDRFVLTAAHCVRHQELGEVKYARLGQINLDESNITDHRISQRFIHPEYKPPSTYNDIALLKLEQAVKFTLTIKPACLHQKPTLPKDLFATGWGLTSYGGNTAKVLQKVKLDLFSHQICSQTYKMDSRKYTQGIREDRQFCAGGMKKEMDTCQGDSGGPLQIHRPNEDTHDIVGITSFGKSCGVIGLPGVYTRVSYYIPWIEQIVWS